MPPRNLPHPSADVCRKNQRTQMSKKQKKNTFQDSVARYFSACISSIYCWAPFFSPFSSPLRSYHQGQAAYPTSDLSLSFPRPLRSSGGHLDEGLALCHSRFSFNPSSKSGSNVGALQWTPECGFSHLKFSLAAAKGPQRRLNGKTLSC